MSRERTTTPALELRHVSKRFGGLRAINDLSLTVESNAFRAIVGPNGAGKTTLFNLISGRLKIDDGNILFNGLEVTGLPASTISRCGIVRTFQLTNIFAGLTVRQNIWLGVNRKHGSVNPLHGRRIRGVDTRVETLLDELNLGYIADNVVDDLSFGQQRLLDIAIALSMEPTILLLDEPTAGLNRFEVDVIIKFVNNLVGRTTVLLIEHDMGVVRNIATRAIVLHQGELIREGSVDELLDDPVVREIYLGKNTGQAAK